MKISFEAKRLFNNLTGLGNYARTLVGNLQRQYPQNDYILYTPKAKHNPDTEYFFDRDRFTIVKAPVKKLSSIWRSFGVLVNIKRDKPEIYHGLSHDLPFSVQRLHKGNTKYVVTIHDVCYKTFPRMYAPVERMIYKFKYSHSLRVADAVVAISESTKRDILTYFPWVNPSKIHTIYQALNPVYYQPLAMEKAQEVVSRYGVHGDFVLYVGSINSRKNLMGVVRAYTLIEESQRLPLVIIGGGGKYKDEVVDYADQNDILKHMLFIDNVTLPENLQAFYTVATAMVYPSFYEGFGLPVAEALLCGTPVVTSNVSSLPEAAGKGAIYVNPESDEEIAAAISLITSDKLLAAELARAGREYVMETLSPELLTQQIMNLYRSL